jgi:uncharacterized protein YbjQ (UPF0145 family)
MVGRVSWSQPSGRRPESELDRIARGGLASSTEQRLKELTRWGGFSSFMDSPEFSVAESVGVQPVCQVVGLATGEVTAGYVRAADRWKRPLKSTGVSGEDPALSDARWQEHPQIARGIDELRKRAFARLVKQATQLQCQAVVGVEPRRLIEPAGEGGAAEVVYEFKGTAVRVDGWERRKEPVLTLIGVRELSLMLAAGVEPVGVVGGIGRIELRPSDISVQASRRRGFAVPNVELGDLTQAMYEARHVAVKTLRTEATALGATGVLDLNVELEHHGSATQQFGSVVFTAFALGSAVRRVRDGGSPSVGSVVGLGGARG